MNGYQSKYSVAMEYLQDLNLIKSTSTF